MASRSSPCSQLPFACEYKVVETGDSLRHCEFHVIDRDCRCQAPDFAVKLSKCECCHLPFLRLDFRRSNPANCATTTAFLQVKRIVAASW